LVFGLIEHFLKISEEGLDTLMGSLKPILKKCDDFVLILIGFIQLPQDTLREVLLPHQPPHYLVDLFFLKVSQFLERFPTLFDIEVLFHHIAQLIVVLKFELVVGLRHQLGVDFAEDLVTECVITRHHLLNGFDGAFLHDERDQLFAGGALT
jgi:hypothetical protein